MDPHDGAGGAAPPEGSQNLGSPENAVNLLAALAAAPVHTMIPPPDSSSEATTPVPSTSKRKRKATPDIDFTSPDAEIERLHPTLPGPIFIHPPTSTTQACIRCHKVKRKCDGNARFKCRGCVKNEDECVFELNPGASTLVRALKERNAHLEEELRLAMRQIRGLETAINQLNPDNEREVGLFLV